MKSSTPINADQASAEAPSSPASSKQSWFQAVREDLGAALGLFLIRIWLGVRTIISGIEKFAGYETGEVPIEIDGEENEWGLTDDTESKFYALENYQGVPESMMNRFATEPMLPSFALSAFNTLLGPALLIFGVTVLLGILPRVSLFLMGLMYMSLTVGLVLIAQDAGVAWLAAHIILIAIGLIYADRDRFTLLGRKW